MTKAYFRLGENNIASIVMNPEKVYKNSFRKMPNLGVKKEEVVQLVEFFKWVGTIENRHWPPQDEKFVKAYRLRETSAHTLNKVDIVMGACGGCHSLDKLGRSIAGDFNEIARGTGFDRATLVKFTLNPQSVRSNSGMPPQNISPETAELIADFILSLKTGKEVQK
jgi:nitric oxide reductase subunit C